MSDFFMPCLAIVLTIAAMVIGGCAGASIAHSNYRCAYCDEFILEKRVGRFHKTSGNKFICESCWNDLKEKVEGSEK